MLRLLLLLCVFTATAFCQNGISKRTRGLFEWFDSLGYVDTAKAKFVLVRTGASATFDGKREDDISAGFLLEDNGPTFRAVLADLTISLCKKAGKDEKDEDYCGYREISIVEEARRVLRELQKKDYFKRWQDERYFAYYDRLERFAQIFVLARACAQRGHGALAESLVQALHYHPSRDGSNPNWGSLREQLESRIEWPASWNFRISLRDPKESWATLRNRAESLHKAFPGEGYDEFEKTFAQLATEEVEHARTAPKSLDGLVSAEKARELAWRMRDEQDEVLESDYWHRPWPFEPRKSTGAMAGLRELGFDAVPALIAELRNPRLSRSIFRNHRYGGGVSLSETNELAVSVLNEIAGVNFYWLVGWNTPEQRSWSRLADEIEKWWKTVESKGENQWLIETVKKGGSEAIDCAPRLREKFPESFSEAVIEGARKSHAPHHRAELSKKLWDIREPRVDEFFREELRSGPAIGNRVAAACVLRHRGVTEAEVSIREEWLARVKDGVSINRNEEILPIPAESSEHALQFLINGNSLDSLKVILSAWPQLPEAVRLSVVEKISRRDFEADTVEVIRTMPATKVLFREILLTALAHSPEITRQSPGGNDSSQIAELAAESLNGHWPDKFPYDSIAPKSFKHRQIISMVNVHRLELGQSTLPMPLLRSKVPAAKANNVVLIEWQPGSAEPDTATRNLFNGWLGRPVNADTIAKTLAGYARKPFAETRGLQLVVERDGDSTGVVVKIRLTGGKPAKNAGRNTNEMVRGNGDVTHSSSSSGDADSQTKTSDWARFRDKASKAISSPPNKWFELESSVSLNVP